MFDEFVGLVLAFQRDTIFKVYVRLQQQLAADGMLLLFVPKLFVSIFFVS